MPLDAWIPASKSIEKHRKRMGKASPRPRKGLEKALESIPKHRKESKSLEKPRMASRGMIKHRKSRKMASKSIHMHQEWDSSIWRRPKRHQYGIKRASNCIGRASIRRQSSFNRASQSISKLLKASQSINKASIKHQQSISKYINSSMYHQESISKHQ